MLIFMYSKKKFEESVKIWNFRALPVKILQSSLEKVCAFPASKLPKHDDHGAFKEPQSRLPFFHFAFQKPITLLPSTFCALSKLVIFLMLAYVISFWFDIVEQGCTANKSVLVKQRKERGCWNHLQNRRKIWKTSLQTYKNSLTII